MSIGKKIFLLEIVLFGPVALVCGLYNHNATIITASSVTIVSFIISVLIDHVVNKK